MKLVIIFTLCGLFHCSLSAPWYSSSGSYLNNVIEDTVNIEDLTLEIKASLEFIKVLPSPTLPRKVTEAVTILSQALTNPNPILHTACENALFSIKVNDEDSGVITKKLESFLKNFDDQLSAPGSMFPEKFSTWLKNQISTVQEAIQHNQESINRVAEKFPSGDAISVMSTLNSNTASFESFIVSGLEKLESQPQLRLNTDIREFRKLISADKYTRSDSQVVWYLLANEDSETSIDFLPALDEIYKLANPDLQATPQAVISSVQNFLKSLPENQYNNVMSQLGSWEVVL